MEQTKLSDLGYWDFRETIDIDNMLIILLWRNFSFIISSWKGLRRLYTCRMNLILIKTYVSTIKSIQSKDHCLSLGYLEQARQSSIHY